MTTDAGVRRDAGSLAAGPACSSGPPAERPETADGWELANLVLLGPALVAAAEARREEIAGPTTAPTSRSVHPTSSGAS